MAKISTWIITAIVGIAAVIALVFFSTINHDSSENVSIPTTPIHWHANLTIIIDGKQIPIPANVGLGKVHQPMHTHDNDNVIHVENKYPTKKTMQLGYFFEVWDKQFSENCIFEYCTDKGTLTMTINGQQNNAFDEYIIRDADSIIIEYKTTSSKNI